MKQLPPRGEGRLRAQARLRHALTVWAEVAPEDQKSHWTLLVAWARAEAYGPLPDDLTGPGALAAVKMAAKAMAADGEQFAPSAAEVGQVAADMVAAGYPVDRLVEDTTSILHRLSDAACVGSVIERETGVKPQFAAMAGRAIRLLYSQL